jgi:hypothetical protein
MRKKAAVGVVVTCAGALGALAIALFGLPGHAQSGPPQKDMAIGAATRSATIQAAIDALDTSYVDPGKATLMASRLRAKLGRGGYDTMTSAQQFADALADDLRQASHDQHLEVRYFEAVLPELPPGQDESADEKAEELLHGRRFNFGVEGVQRLHGDIGYIDLHAFDRPQYAAGRIAAAMALVGDTKALIIDLRKCGGGDPETVMLFASYLFDAPTHLNDIYWRDENRTESRWTSATVPGPRYGGRRKVYLLTSGDTFSGCEDFAYALKNAGRATLVGETTGGGAHAGMPHRLGAHFMMFVPSGRPISPVTHTDWEGVGVVPDVPKSADDSLVAAQVAILKHLVATESDPDWKAALQHTLADLE